MLRSHHRINIRVDRVLRKYAGCHRRFTPSNAETVSRLERLCKQHGQGHMAALLSVNERSVRRWLKGESNLCGPAAKMVWLLYTTTLEPGRITTLTEIATWWRLSKQQPVATRLSKGRIRGAFLGLPGGVPLKGN
jgi:hypothetical protein